MYSDDLYQLLLRNANESRELKKQIRKINKELAALGYAPGELSAEVRLNLDFARANMKSNIYDQAVLEGVSTTFPQTEDIIDNGTVNGMTAGDVQKILNLKHAWEFILDEDVICADSDYYLLSHIARLVNEGFYSDGGRIRGVPVSIGGSADSGRNDSKRIDPGHYRRKKGTNRHCNRPLPLCNEDTGFHRRK